MALQSLYVEWMSSSSASENDVECPTRRYIIRLRDAASSRAKSLRFGPSESSAVVSGLPAGSVQRVRLVVDTACRHGRSKASRWHSVRLPAATVSTPGRITKSVRDLQARETAFQRKTSAVASLFVFYCISLVNTAVTISTYHQ